MITHYRDKSEQAAGLLTRTAEVGRIVNGLINSIA